jgi:hypothetical protein
MYCRTPPRPRRCSRGPRRSTTTASTRRDTASAVPSTPLADTCTGRRKSEQRGAGARSCRPQSTSPRATRRQTAVTSRCCSKGCLSRSTSTSTPACCIGPTREIRRWATQSTARRWTQKLASESPNPVDSPARRHRYRAGPQRRAHVRHRSHRLRLPGGTGRIADDGNHAPTRQSHRHRLRRDARHATRVSNTASTARTPRTPRCPRSHVRHARRHARRDHHVLRGSERSECLRTSRTASNGHTGGDLRNALPLLTGVKWVLRPSGTAKTIAPLGVSAVETAKHSPNSPEKCWALRHETADSPRRCSRFTGQ